MAANVTTTLNSWSTTESSNRPVTGDTVDVDDELRMIQTVVRKYLATKGADIASAATVDLSTATGNYVHITGTTTVTALGTLTAGVSYLLVFDGALTFTHNATSLILPGAANITTAAGDRCEVVSLGSGNWRCLWFQKASGKAVIANAFSEITGTAAISQGGTGQTTATAAFDALAPTTTQGDIIYHNGTDNVRLAKGTAAQVLTMNAGATAPEWATASSTPAYQKTKLTTGDVSTTSTTLVDMTGVTVSITTGARPVHISFSGSHSGTATAITTFNVDIDGTLQFGTSGIAYQTYGAAGYGICIAFDSDVLTAGSHTIKIQWKVNTGTGVMKADSVCPAILSVHEIV